MALLDSRGIASQRGPSSSFRRKTATADAVTQIAAIWYGTRHWKDYCTTAEQLEDVLEGLRDFNPAQPAPSPLKAQKR
jgi:hypothetical protein